MKRILVAAGAFLSLMLSTATFADGYYVAHVTAIDPTRVGDTTVAAIYFQVDLGMATACPLGTWLFYVPPSFGGDVSKQLANTKAVLSSIQLAYTLGKTVNMYVLTTNQAAGFCQVIYITNQP